MATALPPVPVSSPANDWMRSWRRAPSTTFAPCAERCRAVASPSPLLAPVMTTTLPAMLSLMTLTPACRDGRSETGPLLQGFGVPRPLDRDLRGSAFDLAEIVRRELECNGAEVFFQARELRGAGDRNDPRLPGEQPIER